MEANRSQAPGYLAGPAAAALELADEEGWSCGARRLRLEDLLLGLLREEKGAAGRCLRALGITAETVRAQARHTCGRSRRHRGRPQTLPNSREVSRLFSDCLEWVSGLGGDLIGTEHLLHALVQREEEGLATGVLSRIGVQPADVLRQLAVTVGTFGPDPPPGEGSRGRVSIGWRITGPPPSFRRLVRLQASESASARPTGIAFVRQRCHRRRPFRPRWFFRTGIWVLFALPLVFVDLRLIPLGLLLAELTICAVMALIAGEGRVPPVGDIGPGPGVHDE